MMKMIFNPVSKVEDFGYKKNMIDLLERSKIDSKRKENPFLLPQKALNFYSLEE